jgi:RNA polymerase sigma factor (sigma-70 family)
VVAHRLQNPRPLPEPFAVIVESTEELVRRIRQGDGAARQRLYDRYLPLLQRWAHGRLPRAARDINDTDDLVQVTLLRTLRNLTEFAAGERGGFLAYLRQILLNEVRGELRKQRRHGIRVELDENAYADDGDSVVAHIVGHERLEAYERALVALDRREQELVVMRLEFGMSYQEIAVETSSTADAVRMAVARALKAMTQTIAA